MSSEVAAVVAGAGGAAVEPGAAPVVGPAVAELLLAEAARPFPEKPPTMGLDPALMGDSTG